MAVNVNKITLWRIEVDNKPGTLAQTLKPLAEAGADLQVVMGYRFPGKGNKAAIEVAPLKQKKSKKAAESAGMSPSGIPAVMVEADNRPGLGYEIGEAVAASGINLSFVMAQVMGKRCSAVIGFESEEDAKKGVALIRKATAPRSKKKKR